MPATLPFGPFVFDPASMTLARDGKSVALGGRGAALLQAMLAADGPVGKDALMEAAWPGTIVEEANLSVQIATLRKALGTREDGQEWIVTVPRVGYRLLRPVSAEAPSSGGRPSIAVLPFANLSADPEQAFFADGIVEDLITALSRFKTFAVVARNSSFLYKDRAVDVREVATALGVRYVLEGSVRRSAGRVRVTAQLVDAETGAHIWAEKFDGALEDVFDFQDQITESVIGLIEPRIRKAEIDRARRKRPENLDAYELYLKALPIVYSTDVPAYGEAIDMLDRAVVLDPTFAPGLALAAWAHEKRLSFGRKESKGVDDEKVTLALVERALEADPDDAMVLAIAGWMLLFLRNEYDAGLALSKRALVLNPNSLIVLNFGGIAHHHAGDLDEAIACHERALQLSPGAPDTYWSLTGIAVAHMYARRFEEAVSWALRSLDEEDGWELSYRVLAVSYAHLGRIEEAQAALGRFRALRPEVPEDTFISRPPRDPARSAVWKEGMEKAKSRA